MRIVEDTKVVRLRRVGSADLARLDLQFGLAKAAALDKDLICNARAQLAKGLAVVDASKDWTYDWARALRPAWGSCPREGHAQLPLRIMCCAIKLVWTARKVL